MSMKERWVSNVNGKRWMPEINDPQPCLTIRINCPEKACSVFNQMSDKSKEKVITKIKCVNKSSISKPKCPDGKGIE